MLFSHPTQKPSGCYREVVRTLVLKKEVRQLLLFHFAGTGSECYVCDQRGYKWVGFDINKDYVDMGNILVRDGFPSARQNKKLQKINFLDRK